MKKQYDEKKAAIWGSPDYLIKKFDDIEAVRELTRSCKPVRSVKRIAAGARTPKNRLSVVDVYETTGRGADGPVTRVIAHLTMGLNGPGRQEDYFNGIAKLLNSGKFRVVDVWIDLADDLMDVLVSFDPHGGL